ERILDAWRTACKPGEELVLAGAPEGELQARGYALPAEGVRVLPMLPYGEYRSLLRRTRAFVCAARREDYGIAQLEALADGCMLVTTPSPGPYVALPIARDLDSRLVGEDLASSLRTALDAPAPDYAARAALALEPFRRTELDRIVAQGRVLATSSASSQALRAVAMPQRITAKRSTQWASESIRMRTPARAAARAWTSPRSRRLGLALISRIVPVRAAASITAGRSKA